MATGAKPDYRTAHRANGHVTGESDDVCHRHCVTVLELNRLQQVEGLVQIRIVGPAPLRIEADPTAVAASTTIGLAIVARAVPRQTDHERRVVPEVSRPKILGIGEHGDDVVLKGLVRGHGKVGLAAVVAVGARSLKGAIPAHPDRTLHPRLRRYASEGHTRKWMISDSARANVPDSALVHISVLPVRPYPATLLPPSCADMNGTTIVPFAEVDYGGKSYRQGMKS